MQSQGCWCGYASTLCCPVARSGGGVVVVTIHETCAEWQVWQKPHVQSEQYLLMERLEGASGWVVGDILVGHQWDCRLICHYVVES